MNIGDSLWLPLWELLLNRQLDGLKREDSFFDDAAALVFKQFSITLVSSLNLSLKSLRPRRILWDLGRLGALHALCFRVFVLAGLALRQSKHKLLYLFKSNAFLCTLSKRHDNAWKRLFISEMFYNDFSFFSFFFFLEKWLNNKFFFFFFCKTTQQ